METILLTSPHSKCDANLEVRHCDRVAGQMRALIGRHIERRKAVEIPSDTFRGECDLNRERECTKRSRFNAVFLENLTSPSKNWKVFLDVHSFPKEIETWNEENETWFKDQTKRKKMKYDFVVLYPQNTRWLYHLNSLKKEITHKLGLRVGIFSASSVCYLITEATKRRPDIISFLFEFHEDLPEEKKNRLASVIARWSQLLSEGEQSSAETFAM